MSYKPSFIRNFLPLQVNSPTQMPSRTFFPTNMSPTQMSPTNMSPTQMSMGGSFPTNMSPTNMTPTQMSMGTSFEKNLSNYYKNVCKMIMDPKYNNNPDFLKEIGKLICNMIYYCTKVSLYEEKQKWVTLYYNCKFFWHYKSQQEFYTPTIGKNMKKDELTNPIVINQEPFSLFEKPLFS